MHRALSLLGLALLLACAPAADAAPTWERSFGNDVGGPGADICTVAANCVTGSQADTDGGTFRTAADTAIDAEGNVYVADDFMDRVSKFTADGAFLRAWGWSVHKDLPGQFGVCTVAADCRAGERAPNGGALSSPSGIAVSKSGEVYVAETDANRISVFTTDGAFLRTMGEGVSTGAAAVQSCTVASACRTGGATGIPGSFDKPRGIAFDSTGSYWVAEVANPRVQKFNAADGFNLMVGKDVGGPGMDRCISVLLCGAASPTGLPRGGQWAAVEGIGTGVGDRVFVTDHQSNSVTVLSSDGSFERVLGKDVMGPGTKICNAATLCVPGVAGRQGRRVHQPQRRHRRLGGQHVCERAARRPRADHHVAGHVPGRAGQERRRPLPQRVRGLQREHALPRRGGRRQGWRDLPVLEPRGLPARDPLRRRVQRRAGVEVPQPDRAAAADDHRLHPVEPVEPERPAHPRHDRGRHHHPHLPGPGLRRRADRHGHA
ncbi:NHL repeat-containing protein [Svornostia abyssi]|uniref:NHL repeat-containing protein n=1 Tax=Svornostia abyssi TaxID=2898438 RepID=A0ABY5PLR1_9ACTN|nr:NHL repeat-containing protein [Parviterribacteraceae bacterium J379]